MMTQFHFTLPAGFMTPGYMPAFSAPPSVNFPTAFGLRGRPPDDSQAASSSSQGPGNADGQAASAQVPGSSQQRSTHPQLYAPTVAYVPVSLVSFITLVIQNSPEKCCILRRFNKTYYKRRRPKSRPPNLTIKHYECSSCLA